MDYTDRIPNEEHQDEMGQLLTALAKSRKATDEIKIEMVALIERVKSSDEYLKLSKRLDAENNLLSMFDDQIRTKALTAKHLPKEVVIKNFKEAVILDPDKARTWCFENFKPAMKLDEKVFKSAVKDGLVPAELGKVVEEKRAQIAQDLSKYLGG